MFDLLDNIVPVLYSIVKKIELWGFMKKLNTNEAVEYLQSLHPNIKVTRDTLYHKVHRGQITAEKVKGVQGERYAFKEADLKKVKFRHERLEDDEEGKARGKWQRMFNLAEDEIVTPVEIHSDEDLHRLVETFGELVDGEGLRQLLYEKYKVWYSPGTIKQRRYRGSLLAVGKSGGPRGGWWYPKKQLDTLTFRPQLVKSLDKS
jgi:hypothetical protein